MDNRGGTASLPSDLLVGSLGVQVVNMIMTPAMFARLAVVSKDVMGTACNISAWEGLEIHLSNNDVRLRTIARMLRIWRKTTLVYLDYLDAVMLDDHRRLVAAMCPDEAYDPLPCIKAVWEFPEMPMTEPDSDEGDGSVDSSFPPRV